MGDSSQEFKLLITGDASSAVQATQQAGAATQRLKIDTSDLSDETKRSLGLAAPLEDGLKKTKKAAEEAGEGMGVNRREARELGNELGRLIGVGGLGRASIGGLGTAAFAAAASLEFLKSTWEAVQEGNKGTLDFTIKATDEGKITAIADAYSGFATALKKLREAQNSPEVAAARDIQELKTKLDLLQKILKAEEEEQLANLATQKDQMTPQAYAAAEANIKAAFAGKESSATFDEKQAEIDRKRKEAADLEKASAEKREKANAAANRKDFLDQAQEGATAAQADIKEVKDRIALIERLTSKEKPIEYQGADGAIKLAHDIALYLGRYGYGALGDMGETLDREKLRLTQDQALVRSGAQAKAQQDAGVEANNKADEDQANAEKTTAEADDAQKAFDREKTTGQGTSALDAITRALGQEHAAENNNTPAGMRDAVAALNSGTQAAAQAQSAIKAVGDTNKELHDALFKALNDQAAENKKLAARIAQMGFNGK